MIASTAPGHLEHITWANQVKSPLLQLPAELRNAIYKIAFLENPVLKIHPGWQDPPSYPPRYLKLRGATALSLTCRQIYAEAYPMFMATVTLDIRGRDVQEFVGNLSGERAALVTSIIADDQDGDSWNTGASWVVLAHTKGKLLGLKRAHLDGFRNMSQVKLSKLGSVLDWMTGDCVGKKSLKITMDTPRSISEMLGEMEDFTPTGMPGHG